MKTIKLCIAIMAAVLLTWGSNATVQAFHDGGVAHCDGCHTMHNSEGGESIIEGGQVGVTGDFLTKGTDPSSTCLECHAGTGSFRVMANSSATINLHPGGDFYWQSKTYSWLQRGNTVTRHGYNLGHTIIAADFGLTERDPDLERAPGGIFPSERLACSSCHDPHGKINGNTLPVAGSGSYGDQPEPGTVLGNYRLLGDENYPSGGGIEVFDNPAPVAATDSGAETNSNHTDYGMGMSEWCGNCHHAFFAPGGAGQHKHPASNTSGLGAQNIFNNYNSYVSTGDMSGTAATSYDALVPFERQVANGWMLDPTTTQGPNGSSNVMCLSCHRAHVSAFPNAGRWDFEIELLVDSHPMMGDANIDADDVTASYYGRDIATAYNPNQRSLCNKCHVKD
jgi:hypothetical protein